MKRIAGLLGPKPSAIVGTPPASTGFRDSAGDVASLAGAAPGTVSANVGASARSEDDEADGEGTSRAEPKGGGTGGTGGGGRVGSETGAFVDRASANDGGRRRVVDAALVGDGSGDDPSASEA